MKYIRFIEISHIKVILKEGFLLEIMVLTIKINDSFRVSAGICKKRILFFPSDILIHEKRLFHAS